MKRIKHNVDDVLTKRFQINHRSLNNIAREITSWTINLVFKVSFFVYIQYTFINLFLLVDFLHFIFHYNITTLKTKNKYYFLL